MTTTPRVTFVVPCYNYGRYVVEAVESLLTQTFSALEVIVIDDASQDDTSQVLERYRRDPRVRIVRHAENRGNINTYNEGIGLARGEFVGVLSADDYMLRADAVARQVAIFDQFPDVGFVYSAYTMVDQVGRPFWVHKPWQVDYVRGGLEEFADLIYRDYVHAGAVVRRACHDRLGVYDPRLRQCGDWELWLRLSTRYGVGYVSEPLYAYRQHQSNMHIKDSVRRDVTDERVLSVENSFAALPESAPGSIRELRPAALRHAWLRCSALDCAHGQARFAWGGLTDAARRSPGVLKGPEFYKLMTRLVVLSVVGPGAFERAGRLRHAFGAARLRFTPHRALAS